MSEITLIPSFLLIGRAESRGVSCFVTRMRRSNGRRTKFWIYHNQFFLVLALFYDDFVQELLQTLAKLSLLHRSDFLNGSRSRRESM